MNKKREIFLLFAAVPQKWKEKNGLMVLNVILFMRNIIYKYIVLQKALIWLFSACEN